jgi:RNA polymerase sigma-70 factor, ECF subfamily
MSRLADDATRIHVALLLAGARRYAMMTHVDPATLPVRPHPNRGSSSWDEARLDAAVGLAQNGDDEAFRMLFRAVQPLLLRYLRVLAGADAEDVASEAWVQIVRDLPTFKGDFDAFRGWAATIARHRAIDHHRSARRRPAAGVPVGELTGRASADDTATRAMEIMSTDAAITMIARLPPDQAEAVVLLVIMGLDGRSAARVLGKKPGAVRVAAHRGLRRLSELLGEGRSAGVTQPTPKPLSYLR